MKHSGKIKLAATLVPLAFVFWYVGYQVARPKLFIEKQSAYLKEFQDLDEINNSEDKFIVTHRYPDGSWIALKFEHSCCSGEGFNCIVARDEKGNVFTNEGFGICGYESSGELFRYVEADNSGDFFANSRMYRGLQFTRKE